VNLFIVLLIIVVSAVPLYYDQGNYLDLVTQFYQFILKSTSDKIYKRRYILIITQLHTIKHI
jgi:hypothetical protein